MNDDLNYQVIELSINNQPTLQTLGLSSLLNVELSIQSVIAQPLGMGMLSQVAHHFALLVDEPFLFNDIWIHYIFKENTHLCLLPFVLLESDGICHIILPDSNGYYPWHPHCSPLFRKQVDEDLLLSNMLAAIKSFFLTHLMLDVAENVYHQIGIELQLNPSTSLDYLSEYLADQNLDLFIILTLCFNQNMDEINHFILTSCKSIPLTLNDMPNPLHQAEDISLKIYDANLKHHYIPMVMQAFYKLTSL